MPSRVARPRTGTDAFGARVRTLRRARGLRQQDLADGQYSAAYISMLESGRTRASMKALDHISKKLSVSVAELLGGAPQPNEIEAKLALAKTLVAAEDFQRALEVLRDLRLESLMPRQQLARLRLEGRCFLLMRQAQQAMPILQRALRLAQQLGDRDEEAQVRTQLGSGCYYTAAYREALQHFLSALDAIQRGDVHDANLEFRVLSNLGNAYAALGEQPAAIGYYERALAMAGDIVDQDRLADVHAGLAFAYTKREDYEAAITHARTSLALYEQIGAKRTVPEVMNNLAYLYGKVGNRSRADGLLEQAIERARDSQNRYIVPHLLLSRAELYAKSDPAQALVLAQRALEAAQEVEQHEAILSSRLFLATLETDPARARSEFGACLALARANGPDRVRRVLEAHADWEENHGDLRAAARLRKQALHTS